MHEHPRYPGTPGQEQVVGDQGVGQSVLHGRAGSREHCRSGPVSRLPLCQGVSISLRDLGCVGGEPGSTAFRGIVRWRLVKQRREPIALQARVEWDIDATTLFERGCLVQTACSLLQERVASHVFVGGGRQLGQVVEADSEVAWMDAQILDSEVPGYTHRTRRAHTHTPT